MGLPRDYGNPRTPSAPCKSSSIVCSVDEEILLIPKYPDSALAPMKRLLFVEFEKQRWSS